MTETNDAVVLYNNIIRHATNSLLKGKSSKLGSYNYDKSLFFVLHDHASKIYLYSSCGNYSNKGSLFF
jgi:hypothetical protein